MNELRLRVGLLVNPWAGVGGPAGLRGSDGAAVRELALARGSVPQAGERAATTLRALAGRAADLHLRVWGGAMGEQVAWAAGLACEVVGRSAADPTTSADTRTAARSLVEAGIDLLLFAGGDGTARDVLDAVGDRVPVLGIPAGVKMYSAVFAVSPEAAAGVLIRLLDGEPVTVEEAEVRDIDEDAFRADRVLARRYGELRVPGVRGYVQHVKCGPPEDETLARQEIAADVVERLEPGMPWLIGTGGTPKAVLAALGLQGSLLGIDVLRDGSLLATDLDAPALRHLLADCPRFGLVVTATGGQGFVFGRGNQQLTADLLARIAPQDLLLLATRGKLESLAGRPLLVDTGDPLLDRRLAGLRPVITGYRRTVLYRVAPASAPA